MNQRGGFLQSGFHSPGESQTQTVDVVFVDLIQFAVRPVILGAAPHEPVARGWIGQLLECDRSVVFGQRLSLESGWHRQYEQTKSK